MDDQTPIQGDGHIDSISLARLGVLTWQQAELQAPPSLHYRVEKDCSNRQNTALIKDRDIITEMQWGLVISRISACMGSVVLMLHKL